MCARVWRMMMNKSVKDPQGRSTLKPIILEETKWGEIRDASRGETVGSTVAKMQHFPNYFQWDPLCSRCSRCRGSLQKLRTSQHFGWNAMNSGVFLLICSILLQNITLHVLVSKSSKLIVLINEQNNNNNKLAHKDSQLKKQCFGSFWDFHQGMEI